MTCWDPGQTWPASVTKGWDEKGADLVDVPISLDIHKVMNHVGVYFNRGHPPTQWVDWPMDLWRLSLYSNAHPFATPWSRNPNLSGPSAARLPWMAKDGKGKGSWARTSVVARKLLVPGAFGLCLLRLHFTRFVALPELAERLSQPQSRTVCVEEFAMCVKCEK